MSRLLWDLPMYSLLPTSLQHQRRRKQSMETGFIPHSRHVNRSRFIPNREGVDLQASFSLLESPNTSPSKPRRKHSAREIDAQRGNPTFSHCIVLTRQKMRRRIIYTELSSRMKCLETNYQQIQQWWTHLKHPHARQHELLSRHQLPKLHLVTSSHSCLHPNAGP